MVTIMPTADVRRCEDTVVSLMEIDRGDIRELIRDLLHRGEEICFSSFGNSMQPLIDSGSIVSVKGCSQEQMQIGNVVLIMSDLLESKYLIHRITRIEVVKGERRIYTKGDSSPRDVQYFTEATCVGRVTNVLTRGIFYDLTRWYWRPLGIMAAMLSSFSGLFVDGLPFFRKKDFQKQIFIQRLANSTLKRCLKLGKLLCSQRETVF